MSEPAISLARYAQRIGYRDCAFFGVHHGGDDDWECRRVWSKSQRDMVEWALREAQEEIEAEIGYHLAPSWIVAERHPYGDPLVLNTGHVIAGGVKSDTVLADSVAPDYSADPATITAPLGTCAPGDARVFLEDTDIEVTPSGYTVAGGNITFVVPWCRLVAERYLDNPEGGWDYANAATWRAPAVDVRCISNDPSMQAVLIWRHNCNAFCAQRGCRDYRATACLYVRDGKRGIVDVTRADYAAGIWTATTSGSCCRGVPQWVEVSYQSGLTTLTRQAEDTIIRLAHAKMPEEPCGCNVTQRLWERDRHTPEILTRERINCPFGMSDGAWTAWRFARSMALGRASVL